jgi:hypothetical protein
MPGTRRNYAEVVAAFSGILLTPARILNTLTPAEKVEGILGSGYNTGYPFKYGAGDFYPSGSSSNRIFVSFRVVKIWATGFTSQIELLIIFWHDSCG